METISYSLDRLIGLTGLPDSVAPYVRYTLLVAVAIALAWLAGWLCRRIVVPLVLKVTARTKSEWDDVVFGPAVLNSASKVVPAIVIWVLLPWVFSDFQTTREALARLTAVYITVMMTRTIVVFIDSFKLLRSNRTTARQQYLYTFCGVLKIILIFIATIVTVAILLDKDPSTLFAGLGAASAILMLAFQDTIKGLVAGVRLTSNDMLHVGDWITVPSAGANGTVEEITLTTVKVRNFDNTITTVTPQTLVDGSFQNWLGMQQRQGRRQVRKIPFDFRSVHLMDDGKTVNATAYRQYMEDYLRKCDYVHSELGVMVRQADATHQGMVIELVFWLKAQDWASFEHQTSEIMEHAFAAAHQFDLIIFPSVPRLSKGAVS